MKEKQWSKEKNEQILTVDFQTMKNTKPWSKKYKETKKAEYKKWVI